MPVVCLCKKSPSNMQPIGRGNLIAVKSSNEKGNQVYNHLATMRNYTLVEKIPHMIRKNFTCADNGRPVINKL
jgi:hypothetical protein